MSYDQPDLPILQSLHPHKYVMIDNWAERAIHNGHFGPRTASMQHHMSHAISSTHITNHYESLPDCSIDIDSRMCVTYLANADNAKHWYADWPSTRKRTPMPKQNM